MMRKLLEVTTTTLALAALAACGDAGSRQDTDGGNEGGGPTSAVTTGTLSTGDGETATTGDVAPTTSGPTTQDPTTTTGESSAGLDTTGDTTGEITGDTTGEITGASTSDTATTVGECTPSGADETVCDGLDDDCNGIVDDVDAGGDGICDCLRLGLLGKSGGLNEAQFQVWLEERGTAVTVYDEPTLTPALFAEVDIMIIGWLSRTYTVEEGLALRDWLEGGGGVMMMNGYSGDPVEAQTPYNVVLEPLGLMFFGPLQSDTVTTWTDHPVGKGVTAVKFLGGYWVGPLMGMPGPADPIASLGGQTVAVAQERGLGRIIIWGDEWIKYDSEWMTADVPTLWVNIFNWVSPSDICVMPQ